MVRVGVKVRVMVRIRIRIRAVIWAGHTLWRCVMPGFGFGWGVMISGHMSVMHAPLPCVPYGPSYPPLSLGGHAIRPGIGLCIRIAS